MHRRKALKQMGAGAAGLLLLPDLVTSLSTNDAIRHLADLIRATPRDEVLDAAAGAIHAGAGYTTLLGAAFVAGIQDVEPRHVGGKLHCVMMVESAYQMAATLPERDALLLALWNIDDFKRSQARDRQRGDWVMPPLPSPLLTSVSTAREELIAAMNEWDLSRADRAVVSLLRLADVETTFETLWPYCGRSLVDIGHKIIYGAQIQRALDRIGPRYAEPALRSLVFALLHTNPSGNRATGVHERTLSLVPSIPGGWLDGKESPQRSLDILREVRTAGSEQSQRAVIDAMKSGLGVGTIWDGLYLSASEVFLRKPEAPPETGRSLLPVHAVTEINAFGYVFRSTPNDDTKRQMILQAAGWLPEIREALIVRNAHVRNGPTLDSLGKASGKGDSLETALEARSPDMVCGGLSKDPGWAGDYTDRMKKFLATKGVEHHQHKYAAAFLEDSLVVDKRWRPFILAPAVSYLPTGAVPDTDVALRSVGALRKAGVIS